MTGVGISVLMAVHAGDRSDWLGEALESIRWQTRPADEVVLIEDGPLRAPLHEVLGKYKDCLGIRALKIPATSGLGNALAEGMARCSHSLIARMDADDISEPERFAHQAAEFRDDPTLSVLGTAASWMDSEGNPLGPMNVPLSPEEVRDWIWACPFIHPSVMFRRQAILDVGNYNPGLKTRQDYELWFRCAAAGLVMRNMPERLIRYRRASGQKNRRWGVVWKQARIGLQGCKRVNAPWRHWIAVTAPLFMYFLPDRLATAVRDRYKFS